jgi:hypothetical protein
MFVLPALVMTGRYYNNMITKYMKRHYYTHSINGFKEESYN